MAVSRVAAKHWDQDFQPGRLNWWNSEKCQAYYNAAVCGSQIPGNSAGCRARLAEATGGQRLERGISIGCASAGKELALLQDGLVERFDLWEISPRLAREGEKAATDLGLRERIQYHVGDAFTESPREAYDLVYWDHSLHHMSDVVAALRWSIDAVRPGGYVLVNDYIGPNRLQWRRAEVDRANALLRQAGLQGRVRHSTPISYLKQWRRDPSEAPQSERIADALADALPGVPIEKIGGTLINILGPVVVPQTDEDSPGLDALLAEDARLRAEGSSHFVFTLWRKPGGNA